MSALLIHIAPGQAPPTLVTLAGEIDIGSVSTLRRHLGALSNDSTIVDMSGVRLLSAAGVTELAALRDRLAHVDKSLALAAARPLVRRILAITGLGGTVLVTDTVDAATHLIPAASSLDKLAPCVAPTVRSLAAPRRTTR